ncbi:unnamed protein product, partial [Laminaria digitata]
DAPRVGGLITQEDVSADVYLGQYYSEELEATYSVQINDDGKLVLQNMRHGTIELSPIIEDVFHSDHWFMVEVEFVRDSSGKITGFLASNNRSLNILFNKF